MGTFGIRGNSDPLQGETAGEARRRELRYSDSSDSIVRRRIVTSMARSWLSTSSL